MKKKPSFEKLFAPNPLKTVRTTLRIPEDMMKAIKKSRGRNTESLNKLMVRYIAKGMDHK